MAKKSMVEKNKYKEGVQHRNRCGLCGRPRGFMRFFGVCRLCFRSLATSASLPGVTKSSW